jgi:hypothetical protein
MEPGTLDLFFVGFRGFAVAAGAAIVLAVGAHGWIGPRTRSAAELIEAPAAKPGDPRKVAKFMVDCMEAAPRSRVESAQLYAAYQNWCENNNARALPAPQFADALVPVLNEVGIKRKLQGDDLFLMGVRLAS